jgi:hypothetical protein
MKKLRNLCFAILIACVLIQTNQTYGSQRFMNFARYATAAAARCSQTFQNVKQSKPVKWIAENPSIAFYIGTALVATNELLETKYSMRSVYNEIQLQLEKEQLRLEEERLQIEKKQARLKKQKEHQLLLESSYGIKNIPVPTEFSPVTEKILFLKKLIAHETVSTKDIYEIFYSIKERDFSPIRGDRSYEDVHELITLLLQRSLERKELGLFLVLHSHTPETLLPSEKMTYKDRLGRFVYDVDNAIAHAPLFNSTYMESNIFRFVQGINILEKHFSIDKPLIGKFFEEISAFARQEYAKGNIVLFHGQHDKWEFFEKIFSALLHIKYGTTPPKDYVRLRFCEQAVLSDSEVAEIRREGITRETYDKYRDKVLFTNLHLLANHLGSNSLFYILENRNSDQSSRSLNCDVIRDAFTVLDIPDELDSSPRDLQNQFYSFFYRIFKEECDSGVELECDPEVELETESFLWLYKLYMLYKKAVVARNDTGRLVALSLPKDVARTVCYATTSGGPLKPVIINNQPTTDIITIAENYDQVPFDNEYALILSETITNPEKAAAAGIVMKTFTSEPTEESKKYEAEFEAEFAKVMNRIKQMYHARSDREGK